jgi:hypothetical protein
MVFLRPHGLFAVSWQPQCQEGCLEFLEGSADFSYILKGAFVVRKRMCVLWLFVLIFGFPFAGVAGAAMPPEIEWQKCHGGPSVDEAGSIQQTSDGGYIVAGKAYSNDGDVSGSRSGSDGWVVKLGPGGNPADRR